MQRNWGRAVVGGLVATVVMSLVGMFINPLLGLPAGDTAKMLAGVMGGNLVLGWVGHLMIGVVLAIIYVLVVEKFPGAPAVRGALYSLVPWLMAMVAVLPMMGMPAFGGSAAPAIGSLIAHVVYGATLGAIYGLSPSDHGVTRA